MLLIHAIVVYRPVFHMCEQEFEYQVFGLISNCEPFVLTCNYAEILFGLTAGLWRSIKDWQWRTELHGSQLRWFWSCFKK